MTQAVKPHPHTAIAEGMQMEQPQPQLKPEAQRIIIEICLNALARKAAREAQQAKSEEGKGDNARG